MVSSERDTNGIRIAFRGAILHCVGRAENVLHYDRVLQRYTQHLRFIRLASFFFFLMEQVLYSYDSFSPYNASLVAMVTGNCVMTMVNLTLTKPSI